MILREPAGQHALGMLIGTTDSHLSLLPVIREMVPLVGSNRVGQLLRNADICLTSRMEFPLDITVYRYEQRYSF